MIRASLEPGRPGRRRRTARCARRVTAPYTSRKNAGASRIAEDRHRRSRSTGRARRGRPAGPRCRAAPSAAPATHETTLLEPAAVVAGDQAGELTPISRRRPRARRSAPARLYRVAYSSRDRTSRPALSAPSGWSPLGGPGRRRWRRRFGSCGREQRREDRRPATISARKISETSAGRVPQQPAGTASAWRGLLERARRSGTAVDGGSRRRS